MSTATATLPAKQSEKSAPIVHVRDLLEKAREKLAQVAPKYMDVDRMTRILLAACTKSPNILKCTPESILQFAMKCAETGLEPIGAGGCWPIPYGTTLQFIPDYRGLVNAAKHADCIVDCYAVAVHENDEFDYELGLDPKLTHKPARVDRGPLEAAYCVYVLPDGVKRFVVMHSEEIQSIRKRSRASNNGPWVTDESEMWKKTVVRRAMKPFAGMSSQLDAAIAADDAAGGVVEREDVPMPKAIGEVCASGNGKHDPEQQQSPLVPSDDDSPETASADAIQELNSLAVRRYAALRTWKAAIKETYGIASLEMMTPEQAEKEKARLMGMAELAGV